jgi:hypothetical protein
LLTSDLAEKTERSLGQTEILQRSEQILEDLTNADLQARLWRWAGPPSWRIQALLGEAPREEERVVEALARELIAQPRAFEKHIEWLISEEAERRGALFFALGKLDRGHQLLQGLLRSGSRQEWPQAFSAYVAGWAVSSRPEAEAMLDHLAESRPELATGVLRATSSLSPDAASVDRMLRLAGNGTVSRQDAIREMGPLRWEDLAPEDFERLVRGLDDGLPETRASLLWPFLRRLARETSVGPGARELAWSFLDSTASMQGQSRGHEWDFLAAKLGRVEPGRLLALIGSLTTKDWRSWQILSLEGKLPLVWRTLTSLDRQGLVQLLLKAEMTSGPASWVGWELERMVNPAEDADVLLGFAHENGLEAARAIAGLLDASKPGFWEVVRRLLSEWGGDEIMRSRLAGQVGSGAYSGSAVPMVTERLDAARRLLSANDARVTSWAQEVVEFLEDWRRRADRDDREDWIWDYRIRRAELEGMVRSPDSPQRIWAIGRLLKDAPPERVRELLTPEEILAALPRLTELDEPTRRKWAAYARHFLEG